MLIEFLENELAKRSRKNTSYSLRSFARSLEMNPGTLSSLLKRKRPVSVRTAQKILDRLDIDLHDRERILFSFVKTGDGGQLVDDVTLLKKDIFEVMSSWEYDAILSLLHLTQYEPTLRNLSASLGIGIGPTLQALTRLEGLGLIQKQGSKWSATEKNFRTTPDVSSAALKKVHKQYLEKALKSIEGIPRQKRDITGVTMAIDSKKLDEARKMITDFRRKLCSFLESGESDMVARLNIQLFPIQKEET